LREVTSGFYLFEFANSKSGGMPDENYNKTSNKKVEAVNDAVIDSKTMSSTKPAYIKGGFSLIPESKTNGANGSSIGLTKGD
jgi:hypothetical protein